MRMNDESMPYRAHFPGGLTIPTETAQVTSDEIDYSTLEYAYKSAKEGLDLLKSWQGMDLTESELKVKQQIKARELAVDLLEPIVESMRQALATVDDKYKEEE